MTILSSCQKFRFITSPDYVAPGAGLSVIHITVNFPSCRHWQLQCTPLRENFIIADDDVIRLKAWGCSTAVWVLNGGKLPTPIMRWLPFMAIFSGVLGWEVVVAAAFIYMVKEIYLRWLNRGTAEGNRVTGAPSHHVHQVAMSLNCPRKKALDYYQKYLHGLKLPQFMFDLPHIYSEPN